jgi:hypothetical protein
VKKKRVAEKDDSLRSARCKVSVRLRPIDRLKGEPVKSELVATCGSIWLGASRLPRRSPAGRPLCCCKPL